MTGTMNCITITPEPGAMAMRLPIFAPKKNKP